MTTLLCATSIWAYIAEIADNPRERADLEIANISQQNYLKQPTMIDIPEEGDIPIEICVSNLFPYSTKDTEVQWRQVKPSRMQSDFGPREWSTTPWESTGVEMVEGGCSLAAGNGTLLRAMLPVSETAVGEVHYKATVHTLGGADSTSTPATANISCSMSPTVQPLAASLAHSSRSPSWRPLCGAVWPLHCASC